MFFYVYGLLKLVAVAYISTLSRKGFQFPLKVGDNNGDLSNQRNYME